MVKKVTPWHLAVIIPARDEEELLPRCLESVDLALRSLNKSLTADVIVVSDGSTDRTAEIAAKMLGKKGKLVCIQAGTVGMARKTAALVAMERCKVPLERCWLANTDADCVVPPRWLSEQVELAETGIEAVAGTVTVDSFVGHQPWVELRFRMTYLIDSDGSHNHVHGANIGVRADAYLRAGGWSDLSTAEDHDLWRRLSLAGARKLSTSKVEVKTSGRRIGRAPNGFAGALAAHN